jgi:nucleoside-diphosphate-sugar epimerase
MRFLITGATGLVGGHLAEACVRRGDSVTTIARSNSDTSLLEKLGVSVQRGDLTDAALVRQVMEGADVVVHCAAKVGDWGPVEDYRAVNVQGVRRLLEAARTRQLTRFVHISSLGVYAARHHYGTDESEPLPSQHMDGYTQTKVESEQVALQFQRDFKLPVVVLRPGFVYGPRDRNVLPRLIDALKQRTLRYLGGRKRAMNTIYVGNLVDAIFLTIDKPQALGQVYNLTDGEYVSKQRFIETIVNTLQLPPPGWSLPLWMARIAAWYLEGWARFWGAKEAPLLTQARIKFLGLNLDFSIEKAKRELGYQPRTSFETGMQQTLAWYRHPA